MNRRIQPTSSFIKRYINENNVSQKELAELTGYTEKQVSLVLNGKLKVSERFAHALSVAIKGLKEDFILRYEDAYQNQLLNDEAFLNINNYKELSKKYYFSKIFKNITQDPVEQVNLVLEAFNLDNLKFLNNILPSFKNNCLFSKDISKTDYDSEVISVWTKIAMKELTIGEEPKKFVGKDVAKKILKENKELLNVSDSNDLITNLKYIADLCGIHLGFSKSAPATYIRGLTFACDNQLFIILTDRFKKIEYVVFAFVHEMYHIINGDIDSLSTRIRVSSEINDAEDIANLNTRNFLVPDNIFNNIKDKKNTTLSEIFSIAQDSRASNGLVVARLHDETKDYTKFWQLLNNFKIDFDMFGN